MHRSAIATAFRCCCFCNFCCFRWAIHAHVTVNEKKVHYFQLSQPPLPAKMLPTSIDTEIYALLWAEKNEPLFMKACGEHSLNDQGFLCQIFCAKVNINFWVCWMNNKQFKGRTVPSSNILNSNKRKFLEQQTRTHRNSVYSFVSIVHTVFLHSAALQNHYLLYLFTFSHTCLLTQNIAMLSFIQWILYNFDVFFFKQSHIACCAMIVLGSFFQCTFALSPDSVFNCFDRMKIFC